MFSQIIMFLFHANNSMHAYYYNIHRKMRRFQGQSGAVNVLFEPEGTGMLY